MEQLPHWKKPFFTIWIGQAFSLLTSAIVQFAIILYLTDITRSAWVLSAATFMGFLPQAVLGPFIGVYLDRWDRKKVMIVSDCCIALACLVIVFFGFFYPIPVWMLLAVLFIRSLGSAFHSPSLTAITPLIVPKSQLTRCAGYSQTLQSASLILSPALAALTYTSWRLEAILFLDVIGAMIGVFTLSICTIPKLRSPSENEQVHLLDECLAGWRTLQAHTGLVGLLLIAILFSIALTPINMLYPLMSMEYFGGGAAEASIVEMAFSIGMLVGGMILGIWGGFKDRVLSIVCALVVIGAAIFCMGMLPSNGFFVFAVLSGLIGLPIPFASGPCMALYQEKISPEYLGRVMSLITSLQSIASPIGLLLSGALVELIGINIWFIISGILCILCAALCISLPSVRYCSRNSA